MSNYIKQKENVLVKDGVATTKRGIFDYALKEAIRDLGIRLNYVDVDLLSVRACSLYKKRLSLFNATEDGTE